MMDQKVAMESSASGDDHSKLKNTTLSYNNNNLSNDEKAKSWEHSYECSWPPRSHYKCSFCKREFKSAQALGGHMNVHRRDRAKFKSNPSSPPPPSCLNPIYEIAPPNPNPNLYNPSDLTLPIPLSSSSLATTSIYTHQYSLVSLSLSCLSPSSSSSPTSLANGVNLGNKFHDLSSNFKGEFSCNDEDESVKLDLELGLIGDTKQDDQDLDLELRLGSTFKTKPS